MTKENAYISFPFRLSDPTVRYEIIGALTGDGMDHDPGAPQHMRAVRSFVTLNDPSGPVAWVTRDAPLVQPETIAMPYAPFPDTTSPRQPATIYSWVHNNLWDTNFSSQQAFEATWRYAVGVRRRDETDLDPNALGLRPAAAVDQPLIAVRALGPAEEAGPERSLLSVSDPRGAGRGHLPRRRARTGRRHPGSPALPRRRARPSSAHAWIPCRFGKGHDVPRGRPAAPRHR